MGHEQSSMGGRRVGPALASLLRRFTAPESYAAIRYSSTAGGTGTKNYLPEPRFRI